MGTLQKLFKKATNFLGLEGKSKHSVSKHYNADELREEREARYKHKVESRKRMSVEKYLAYKASKNANCGWAKTKGFSLANLERVKL